MGNEQNYSYWLEIQEGSHVRFGDLPLLIAKAQHHDTNDELTSYLACSNLETELKQAVQSGALTVRNPLGLGPHTFPIGQALQDAVVLAQDLEPLLNDKGIGLRIVGREGVPDTAPVNKTDNGTAQIRIGTSKVLSYVITPHIREIPEELANLPPDAIVEYTDWGGRGRRNAAMFVLEERGRMERQQRGLFTPEEASLCLAEQQQWSASYRDEFHQKMLQAIRDGKLVARSPETNLRLDIMERQHVREFWNLVRVGELNQWLKEDGAGYQWDIEATSTAKAIEATEPRQDTETLASKGTNKVWTDERKAEAQAYRNKHGQSAAAKYYGVSTTTISKHTVPPGQQKKTPRKTSSPFTRLGKR